MAKIIETHLISFPMKTLVTFNVINLLVKRPGNDWKKIVSIKASRNNVEMPWSIRFYEYGVAHYRKYSTWIEVKDIIAMNFFVELSDDIGEKLLAKITMIKMSN